MELLHLNQSPVVFVPENHTYFLGEKQLYGITGTLIKRAYPDTYKTPEGMSEEVWQEKLRNAAVNGTFVHQVLENYEDMGIESDIPELDNYKRCKEENGLIHLASEYIVSDNIRYASAIDHVFQTQNGEIILVDVKHTSVIHWDEVTLQLSIYKRFFEMQNPHLKVRAIAVMWLRGEECNFKVVGNLADEVIDELIAADCKGEQFDIQQHFGELPVRFAEVEDKIAAIKKEIDEKKKLYDKLTSGLLELMEHNAVKSFTGSKIQLSVVAATTRRSFDSKRFAKEHPDMYSEYETESQVKSSLRITVKK